MLNDYEVRKELRNLTGHTGHEPILDFHELWDLKLLI